ncbi:hypothetical protein KAT80_01610 [Candidatus Pacearchaeota archaeon]|nr:hypothetical protein [Candidatus Pacearchaeota archaeon]
MNNFQKQKKDILSKLDKSSKKKWDRKIVSLCEKINSFENFYTTSSCSGRVVLIIDNVKKAPGLFIKVWHDLISFGELKRSLEKIKKGKINFKQEPVILHVACDSLEESLDFLKKARSVGFKRGGIIAGNENRFVLELIGTEKLEFLIIENKKILVDDKFLKVVVKKSNENLKKSWSRIQKFRNLL